MTIAGAWVAWIWIRKPRTAEVDTPAARSWLAAPHLAPTEARPQLEALLRALDAFAAASRDKQAATSLMAAANDVDVGELCAATAAERLPQAFARALDAAERDGASYAMRAWLATLGASLHIDAGRSRAAAAILDRFLRGTASPSMRVTDHLYHTKALLLRGQIHLQDGEIAEAQALVREGREEFGAADLDRLDPDRREAGCAALADLAGLDCRCCVDLGLAGPAGRLLAEQRRFAAEGDAPSRLSLLHNEVELRLMQGRPAAARHAIEDWRATHPDPEPVVGFLDAVTLAAASEMDDAHLVPAWNAVLATLESTLPGSFRTRALVLAVDLATRRGDEADARAALAELRAQGDGLDPSEESVLAARLEDRFGAGTSTAVRREHLQAVFEGMIARLQHLPPREGGLGHFALQHRRELLTELIAADLAAAGEAAGAEAALQHLLTAQVLTSSARRVRAEPCRPDEVRQELCATRQGVLLFVAAFTRSFVLVVDAERVRCHALEGQTTLAVAIDAFLERLGQGPREVAASARAAHAEAVWTAGRDLCDRLLPAPVRAVLADWDAVTVSDLGLLQALPLEALPWPGSDALVGERLAVCALDSLPYGLHRLRAEGAAGTRPDALTLVATLLADPGVVGEDVPHRAFLEAELAPLLAPYPSDTHLLNENAEVAALAALRLHGITHILAHGVEPAHAAEPAGLALSSVTGASGVLDRAHAERLDVAGGIVLLSVCGAGRTSRRVGDDTYHTTLGAALLDAGARAVVQSAADLALAPHLELCAVLHQRLAVGLPLAKATRDARCQMQSRHDRFTRLQHAQFRVIGVGL
ncbi:MAG: CHAT domain-containing protein [Planctomycetota bacterium]